jgi:hypothetical protein
MCGQKAELCLVDERDEILDLLLEGGVILVLRDVWVGVLRARVCVTEAGRHGVSVDMRYSWLIWGLYGSCQHAIGDESRIQWPLCCPKQRRDGT